MRAGAVAATTGLASLVLAAPGVAVTPPEPGHAAAAPATDGGVVVNEFAPHDPSGWVDEFVELRNTGGQAADLSGWELVACLSPNTWQVAVTFPHNAVIAPGGHLLLTHIDYATGIGGVPPDFYYDLDLPEDGGWLLHDPSTWNGYADAVGLDSGLDCTEGDPAPQCDWADGEALTRDEQGSDTDDNSADFTCQSRTPGS
jgi:hypothetical protein